MTFLQPARKNPRTGVLLHNRLIAVKAVADFIARIVVMISFCNEHIEQGALAQLFPLQEKLLTDKI